MNEGFWWRRYCDYFYWVNVYLKCTSHLCHELLQISSSGGFNTKKKHEMDQCIWSKKLFYFCCVISPELDWTFTHKVTNRKSWNDHFIVKQTLFHKLCRRMSCKCRQSYTCTKYLMICHWCQWRGPKVNLAQGPFKSVHRTLPSSWFLDDQSWNSPLLNKGINFHTIMLCLLLFLFFVFVFHSDRHNYNLQTQSLAR